MTYNPNQPRDPAGTSTGWQWSSAGGAFRDPNWKPGELVPKYPLAEDQKARIAEWTPRKQRIADEKVVDEAMRAYANNPHFFESDEANGVMPDGSYNADRDINTKMMELYSRQNEAMRELNIYLDPASDPRSFHNSPVPERKGEVIDRGDGSFDVRDYQGNLVGNFMGRERADQMEMATRPAHPIMETDDARGNALAAYNLISDVIATVQEAPPEVRAFLKDTPLNIEYSPLAPPLKIAGEDMREGASVTHHRGADNDKAFTLNLYRATSVMPDIMSHEIGHVYMYALAAQGRSSDFDAMNKAYAAEGGLTNYADKYRNEKGTAAGMTLGAAEQLAELESLLSKVNRHYENHGYQPVDALDIALQLAVGRSGRIAGGQIPGLRHDVPMPKTAAAWLRIRDVRTPAPKDIKTWTEADFRRDWNAQRIFDLAAGKPDPGPFDATTSPAVTRARWSFLSR